MTETIRIKETDALDGRFILDGLPADQYEIQAEGYYFSPTLILTLTADTDLNQQDIYAYPIPEQEAIPSPPDDCCECPKDEEDCDEPVPPEPPDEPADDAASRSVESHDPNEKVSSPGVGLNRIIEPNNSLGYTIYFENVMTATAPAQEVFITDQLDEQLDWNTLRFTEIAFGDQIMPINDPGGGQFYTRLSAPDYRSAVTTTWWVDVTGILDPATGVISWTFRMLDPATSDLPVDALAGFLPPNDETGRGEGHVSFVIDHVGDIPLGSQISNQASIVFDINDPIVTNRVFNTIDQILDNRVYLPLVLK